MMVAIALAIARLGDSEAKETQVSACAVAMATAALEAFSVSCSNLISIAGGGRKAVIQDESNNLSMKKSSIDGNRYLDYLWESMVTIIYNYWWC
jgi:hypothetical protein